MVLGVESGLNQYGKYSWSLSLPLVLSDISLPYTFPLASLPISTRFKDQRYIIKSEQTSPSSPRGGARKATTAPTTKENMAPQQNTHEDGELVTLDPFDVSEPVPEPAPPSPPTPAPSARVSTAESEVSSPSHLLMFTVAYSSPSLS
jgi:hypothetical protein